MIGGTPGAGGEHSHALAAQSQACRGAPVGVVWLVGTPGPRTGATGEEGTPGRVGTQQPMTVGWGHVPKRKGKGPGTIEIICPWNLCIVSETFPPCACYFWLAGLSLLPLHFQHNAAFVSSALLRGLRVWYPRCAEEGSSSWSFPGWGPRALGGPWRTHPKVCRANSRHIICSLSYTGEGGEVEGNNPALTNSLVYCWQQLSAPTH